MHPRNEQTIGTMFDRIAPRYDFLNRLLSLRQDQHWRKVMLSLSPTTEKGSFLDVATGTGDVLLEALKRRQNYGEFVGCDISRGMLELAARKIPQDPRVRLEVASAEKLPFSESHFHCVTIAFGLRNVINKERTLKEFFRVLKPGGRLMILEFFTPRQTLFAKAFLFYFQRILPLIGGLLSDRQAYAYLPESVGTFYLAPELKDKLTTTGYSHIQERSFLFGACRLIIADK